MTDEEMRSEFAYIRIRVDGLPLIGAAIGALQQDVRTLQSDVRMVRAAISDMARTDISAGEVEALHTDVQRVLDRQSEMEARLVALEAQGRTGNR